MGFQWNAPGESLEFIGACPNDTPFTGPESLSWSILAPLMLHQYTSITAMDGLGLIVLELCRHNFTVQEPWWLPFLL